MILDLSNNILCIYDDPPLLKPNQVSQIYFWGFSKDKESNKYILSTVEPQLILIKLLIYLDNEDITYELSPSCLQYLSELRQTRNRLEEIKIQAKDFKDGKLESIKFSDFLSFISTSIARPLKDHQVKAAVHLYLVENGANFSVPGSGKTAVVLSYYEKLRTDGKVNTLFVVGPTACFGPWKTEFKLTLGRDPHWKILAGGDQSLRKSEYYIPISKKAELYLTTYQTLYNDYQDVIKFFTHQGNDALLVIDEAHYIKQIAGSWSNAVLNIAKHARYRCVLTGTPIPRFYTDLFNLFDTLCPDNNLLDENTKIQIQLYEDKKDNESAKRLLEQSIGPLFYRVRKSDLGLVPPNFNPPYIINMNRYEKFIYDAIETKIVNFTKDDYLRDIELVKKLRRGRIIRLRQCVSNIRLLLSVIENYDEDLIHGDSELIKIITDYENLEVPAKLEYLIKLVSELQQQRQKVVIWSHFIGTLKLIKRHLISTGYKCKLIYGETPIEQTSFDEEETREKIRNEFTNPNSGLDILIANPAACGESISLHKTCFHAIYYDLSYNCAQYLQSLDRIHRVGGSEINKANYHFLQYANTIDQDIKSNLEQKAKKMYDIIEEDYGICSLDMFEEEDELQAYERLFEIK